MNFYTFPQTISYTFVLLLFFCASSPNIRENSAVPAFAAQPPISTQADVALWVSVADLDGDGDLDALSASWADDKITWYENLDSNGTFSSEQIISLQADGAIWVTPGDLDGDGDIDAVSASAGDNKVAWYQNLGGGSFTPQQIISTQAAGAESVAVADIDNDGDLDVISASLDDNKVAWYENRNGEGDFSSQRVITTQAYRPFMIYPADVDGDGDQDVLVALSDDDAIAWYENLNGSGNFGPQQIIWQGADIAFSVMAADLDGDGDLDVASASAGDDKVAWYENLDGEGNFGPEQIITIQANGSMALEIADLDLDGDLDVISASADDDKIAWYENLDGQGNFGPQRVISTMADGPYAVAVGDANGDGWLDIFSASWIDDKIAWYKNLGGGWSSFLPLIQ